MKDNTTLNASVEYIDVLNAHLTILRNQFHAMTDLAFEGAREVEVAKLLKAHITEHHRFMERLRLVGMLVADEFNEFNK